MRQYESKEEHARHLKELIQSVRERCQLAEMSIQSFEMFNSGSTADAMRLDCSMAATALDELCGSACDVPLEYEGEINQSQSQPIVQQSPVGGPVGPGIHDCYPLAIGPPLDRVYLKPMYDVLWDTEDLVDGDDEMVFFRRPLGQDFKHTQEGKKYNNGKSACDTNLNQSSMLDYPREFDVQGLGVLFDQGTPLVAIAQFYRHGSIDLTCYGNRLYGRYPLSILPNMTGQHDLRQGLRATGYYQKTQIRYQGEPLKGVLPLTRDGNLLGEPVIKLKPGEVFNATLRFSEKLSLKEPVRIMVVLTGISRRPE